MQKDVIKNMLGSQEKEEDFSLMSLKKAYLAKDSGGIFFMKTG